MYSRPGCLLCAPSLRSVAFGSSDCCRYVCSFASLSRILGVQWPTRWVLLRVVLANETEQHPFRARWLVRLWPFFSPCSPLARGTLSLMLRGLQAPPRGVGGAIIIRGKGRKGSPYSPCLLLPPFFSPQS